MDSETDSICLFSTPREIWLAVCQIIGREFCGLATSSPPLRWLFIGPENSCRRWHDDFKRLRDSLTEAEWTLVQENIVCVAQVEPEEALSREQVIRYYTINNARVLGSDDRLGSLEPGKLADLVVLDTDLLTCPKDRIATTQVLRTYLGGRLAYQRQEPVKP